MAPIWASPIGRACQTWVMKITQKMITTMWSISILQTVILVWNLHYFTKKIVLCQSKSMKRAFNWATSNLNIGEYSMENNKTEWVILYCYMIWCTYFKNYIKIGFTAVLKNEYKTTVDLFLYVFQAPQFPRTNTKPAPKFRWKIADPFSNDFLPSDQSQRVGPSKIFTKRRSLTKPTRWRFPHFRNIFQLVPKSLFLLLELILQLSGNILKDIF